MLYIECKPDFTLVSSITNLSRRDIIHDFRGKGWICNRLREVGNSCGLIDEDPWSAQPPYINGLTVGHDFKEHDVKVLYDSRKGNCVIILRPRLEEWVLKAASEGNIDVRKYNLPNEGVKLHRDINLRLDRFKRLLEDLKDSDRLKLLKRLLEREQ